MYQQSEPKHKVLTDDDNVHWIADVPPHLHDLLQQLLAESHVTGNHLKKELAILFMQTSGTRQGRHADRILEAIRERPSDEVEEDALVDMPLVLQQPDPDGDENKTPDEKNTGNESVGVGGELGFGN